ncbi:MAG TPA: glycosyltransferase [Hymenobacter sp.]
MTPTDFSVLLLAWDDADPKVAVLGGSALPPTLPLVYQLATQQSVVAVYPHLPPAPEAAASTPPEVATAPVAQTADATGVASNPEDAAPPAALHTTEATAGVRLLPDPTSAASPAGFRVLSSRIIGLDKLPPDLPSPGPSASAPPAASGASLPAPARSQWPIGADAPSFHRGAQVPAAPYVGASPEPDPSSTVREAADLALGTASSTAPAPQAPAAAQPSEPPAAEAFALASDPELAVVLRPAPFDEIITEPGPAEALDLLAPEDNITPDALPASRLPAPPAPGAEPGEPAPPPPSTPLLRRPTLDGLNYRMIQYARQAAQLVRGHTNFGVIYAPNWPAWLAALEIRNSTGQPLVVYAASLAIDFSSPAERGWLLEVERMTLRRARVILVPDESLRHRLREQYGATIGEVRVVLAADEEAVQRVLSEIAR